MLERDGLRVRVSHFSRRDDDALRDHAREPRSCSPSSSGAIGLLSVGLIAIEGGPPFTGSTSLFQVFGYFGLFCSTVLAMRVIVAVLRDRLN